jgi:D-aminopeptidase
VVFLGYHAGAGMRGVLSHTYLENSITGVWLNGTPASEGRLNAALAAEHGVPVLLVTGDDMACRDAAGYAPQALTVPVKRYVSRYAAVCIPSARTSTAIREAATRAMARAGHLGNPPVGVRLVASACWTASYAWCEPVKYGPSQIWLAQVWPARRTAEDPAPARRRCAPGAGRTPRALVRRPATTGSRTPAC